MFMKIHHEIFLDKTSKVSDIKYLSISIDVYVSFSSMGYFLKDLLLFVNNRAKIGNKAYTIIYFRSIWFVLQEWD